MLDANWAKHAKILGKLCHLYDSASADYTTLSLAMAALMDQAATGASAGNQAMLLVANTIGQVNLAIANGPTLIQTIVTDLTRNYLTSTYFTADFVTNLPDSSLITDVISAFGKEMATDSKTFTTASSTGLIHFLKALFGTPSPTDYPSAGSPTHADSTYVVSSQV